MADYAYGWDGMTRKHMLTKMEHGWRSAETPCGSGSEMVRTENVRRWLPGVLESLDATSLVDIGAGDLRWITQVDLPGIDYKGLDLVPRHPLVDEFDITLQVPPRGDVVLCRFVLNHLSAKFAFDALENIVKSRSKFLLLTNWSAQANYWRMFNFELPDPLSWLDDANSKRLELHDLGEIARAMEAIEAPD